MIIRGPCSCSIFEMNDRTLMLFGEVHRRVDKGDECISDFVAGLASDTTIMMDIFIEGWHTSSGPSIGCGLRSMRRRFVRSQKNIRVHLCDVRRARFDHDQPALVAMDRINHMMSSHIDRPFIREFLNDRRSPVWLGRIIPVWWDHLKIDRQIANIRNPVIRGILSKFISSEFDRNARILRTQLRQNKPDDIVRTRLCSLLSILMDAYMLGRMLRHFRDNDHPRRIIAYTGDAHYERFLRFFYLLRSSTLVSCIHQNLGTTVRDPWTLRTSMRRRFIRPSTQILPTFPTLIILPTIILSIIILTNLVCIRSTPDPTPPIQGYGNFGFHPILI